MAARAGMRSFGRIRKLPSGYYQASYIGPDGDRHCAPQTFGAKVDAEEWLVGEHRLVPRQEWMPPKLRRAYEEANQPPTLVEYSEGWMKSRDLKLGTVSSTGACSTS